MKYALEIKELKILYLHKAGVMQLSRPLLLEKKSKYLSQPYLLCEELPPGEINIGRVSLSVVSK